MEQNIQAALEALQQNDSATAAFFADSLQQHELEQIFVTLIGDVVPQGSGEQSGGLCWWGRVGGSAGRFNELTGSGGQWLQWGAPAPPWTLTCSR